MRPVSVGHASVNDSPVLEKEKARGEPRVSVWLWALPPLAVVIAAAVPLFAAGNAGLPGSLSAALALAVAFPLSLLLPAILHRRSKALDRENRRWEPLRNGNEGAEQSAERILHAGAEIGGILDANAKRSMVYARELCDSIYRNSAIAGEMRLLGAASDALSASVEHSSADSALIEKSVQDLESRIETQASAVAEISASVEEMNASLRSIAAVASQRDASIAELQKRVVEGEEHLGQLNQLIVRLMSDLDLIVEMTSAIQDIASKTDLLSMNAAIEAAHAGTAGKGFSVVADEIRKLSESSEQSAKVINTALNRIGDSMKSVRSLSDSNVLRFAWIRKEVDDFVQAFKEINGATAESSLGSQEIVTASQSLMEISEVIGSSVHSIQVGMTSFSNLLDRVGESTASTVSSIANTTKGVMEANEGYDRLIKAHIEMRADIAEIDRRTNSRKGRGTADASMMAAQHLQWVLKARLSLDGRLSADARTLGDHKKCELGKWMSSDEAASLRSTPDFVDMDDAHKKLHSLANDIIANSGRQSVKENERSFDALLELSRFIISKIEAILP